MLWRRKAVTATAPWAVKEPCRLRAGLHHDNKHHDKKVLVGQEAVRNLVMILF